MILNSRFLYGYTDVFDSKINNAQISKEFLKISKKDYVGDDWASFSKGDGFIRAYGRKNIEEDIATFVEEINNPSFFKDLINPSSEDYDIIYRQKLDLLYEYNFITEGEYNKVLLEAGVK